MKITTVGIDLAKNVFQIHAIDGLGKVALKKQLKRDKVAEFFVNLPPCLVGMEACGSAHLRRERATRRDGFQTPVERFSECVALAG
jgi:transposase